MTGVHVSPNVYCFYQIISEINVQQLIKNLIAKWTIILITANRAEYLDSIWALKVKTFQYSNCQMGRYGNLPINSWWENAVNGQYCNTFSYVLPSALKSSGK